MLVTVTISGESQSIDCCIRVNHAFTGMHVKNCGVKS